eukprot:scaffold115156_cov24-Tisochrysis_lutea.AAC.3
MATSSSLLSISFRRTPRLIVTAHRRLIYERAPGLPLARSHPARQQPPGRRAATPTASCILKPEWALRRCGATSTLAAARRRSSRNGPASVAVGRWWPWLAAAAAPRCGRTSCRERQPSCFGRELHAARQAAAARRHAPRPPAAVHFAPAQACWAGAADPCWPCRVTVASWGACISGYLPPPSLRPAGGLRRCPSSPCRRACIAVAAVSPRQ